ncbi:hypothetical protein BCR33DRAFT_763225 [Rhizoclosmatium globosum]|uniref:SMAD/FHA domain-containing protein n=1 Tax=Rhizoclosmatium globosum TaxID=329046 RepID=A0A1Y2CQY6_9FUNG|nr:hypothetical protein BCR33DRAFT_763225 [Rhizoclosmatium globosum]|eukprot:ORY49448.1 hypothetical protein BCR33DRAFT_763225 [Rhizoclosmatium globosum]
MSQNSTQFYDTEKGPLQPTIDIKNDQDETEDGEISEAPETSEWEPITFSLLPFPCHLHKQSNILYDPSTRVYCTWDPQRNAWTIMEPTAQTIQNQSPIIRLVVITTSLKDFSPDQIICIDTINPETSNISFQLGRDEGHLFLRELSVSRSHATIFSQRVLCPVYGGWTDYVYICDLGSTQGTFVDGERVADAKEKGKLKRLVHDTKLVIGSTEFKVHVHREWPCAGCKTTSSNLVQTHSSIKTFSSKAKEAPQTGNVSIVNTHKAELNNLKRTLLGTTKTGATTYDSVQSEYLDRSSIRRKLFENHNEPFNNQGVVESQVVNSSRLSSQQQQQHVLEHLYNQHIENESTSDIMIEEDTASRVAGVGEAMLSKLGWKEGSGLGKREDSIKEPIQVQKKEGNFGLGFGSK